MKAETILWLDSGGDNGRWRHLDEMDAEDLAPMAVLTVGIVLAETDSAVTVSAHLVPKPGIKQVHGVLTIPKVAILKRKRVRPPKWAAKRLKRVARVKP